VTGYTEAQVGRALKRAARGMSLDAGEGGALMSARGQQLEHLVEVAGEIGVRGRRDVGRTGMVTYSRKVFIPLTRLCRDRCHYCTFVKAPAELASPYLSADEVLAIARAGAEAGCKEALFTLGDRPELRWPQAAQWLAASGYASTIDYLRAMAILVLEETGLLPHLNPGVMSWDELARLRPVAPSMGLMLETTSIRLWEEPSGPHHGSPDKEPRVRLQVLADAGRLAIPFTTGVLVGIGESYRDRAESVLAIRSAHRAFGHVQEVIVQNFRAKPRTAMAPVPDVGADEFLAAVAASRVLLGPGVRLQVPPNLSEPDRLPRLLAAGVDDWGGVSPVTADHVNPERPWPQVSLLAEVTADSGSVLAERLTIYPEYVSRGEAWLDPRLTAHVRRLADQDGLAGMQTARGLPWQEPEPLAATQGSVGVHGDWEATRHAASSVGTSAPPRLDTDVRAALRLAECRPAALLEPTHEAQALRLLHADGHDLDAVCALADGVRESAVGDTVTFVVNRNINFTNICYTGCRFCAFAQRRTDADAYQLTLEEIVERAREAWELGATEVCLQGGIDPALPIGYYVDVVTKIRSACPDLHVHAFSPMEIATGAAKAGIPVAELLTALKDAGLGSLPGTAAEILDDEVRWVLTKGKLPTSTWVDVVESAHRIGLPTTSTMMFGHVDRPDHWLTHLRVLAGVQDRTGGFTEFVPLPYVHTSAPLYLAGIGRAGPTTRESRVVHAMARLGLHGRIDHIQVSWVKLGPEGVATMLCSGADDLGGTLMEETISAMAGSRYGSAATVATLAEWAGAVGRPVRQRSTGYGPVDPVQAERARRSGGVLDRA
jgi:FO synthase